MTARTPTYLKSRYETGDIPTQSDYEDIFDSYVNLEVSGKQTINSDLATSGEIICARVSASAFFIGEVSANNVYASTGNFTTLNVTTNNSTNTNSTFVSAGTVNITSRATGSVDVSVKAVGSAQATAKNITAAINLLVTVSAGTDDAVILPGGYPGWTQYIINSTTSTCQVFPPSGGTIDGLSTNAAQTLNPLGRMIVHHITSARFFTMRGT